MQSTTSKEIFVRLEKCLGCHSCELACATAHSGSDNLYSALSTRPTPKPRLYVEYSAGEKSVPVLCRHCEEAPCMHACIAGAIRRLETGSLVTDPDRCIGCWTCVMVCPYGVIGRHLEEQKAYRCDRCPDRDQPACVSACPTRALVYMSAAEFSAVKRQQAADELQSEGG